LDTLAGSPQQHNHNWLHFGEVASSFASDPFSL